MRLLIVATLAGVLSLAACQQPVEFDPDDPETIAAIEAVLSEAMEGARNVDADRVLAAAEGEGELTLITGDVMLGGVVYIRETFRQTYDGLVGQDQTVLASRVRVLSPDVAIVIAVSEGTYTDKAGWTSDPVGMGHTLVLVRESGDWKIRHAHQSIAP